jgi:hypothetical protein
MRCMWAAGSPWRAGCLRADVARYLPHTTNPPTHTISADGLYFFPPTGVSIFFTGVSGTGTCTVQRFDAPASNISFTGTPPTFTSQYRFVITALGFTFTSAELRFNRTQIPNAGIGNAGTVSVYRRPTSGTGQFSILPNAFNSSFPDEVRATTTAFSEFILEVMTPITRCLWSWSHSEARRRRRAFSSLGKRQPNLTTQALKYAEKLQVKIS